MSRIIEFRKSAQKAEKQSVQGKTCAFTGHRPQSLPFGFDESDKRCTSLKSVMRDQIVALIENEGVTHFITGMALGVDMYAAEIVLDLKSKYPHITLESALADCVVDSLARTLPATQKGNQSLAGTLYTHHFEH